MFLGWQHNGKKVAQPAGRCLVTGSCFLPIRSYQNARQKSIAGKTQPNRPAARTLQVTKSISLNVRFQGQSGHRVML